VDLEREHARLHRYAEPAPIPLSAAATTPLNLANELNLPIEQIAVGLLQFRASLARYLEPANCWLQHENWSPSCDR
jgi:hypothetical protein